MREPLMSAGWLAVSFVWHNATYHLTHLHYKGRVRKVAKWDARKSKNAITSTVCHLLLAESAVVKPLVTVMGGTNGGGWQFNSANKERRKLYEPDLCLLVTLQGTFRSYLEDSRLKAVGPEPSREQIMVWRVKGKLLVCYKTGNSPVNTFKWRTVLD